MKDLDPLEIARSMITRFTDLLAHLDLELIVLEREEAVLTMGMLEGLVEILEEAEAHKPSAA